jgi:hypothetical protein
MAIPDASGVIHGCVLRSPPHSLRLIDSEAREECLRNETAVAWQTIDAHGPPGGPEGPAEPAESPEPQDSPGQPGPLGQEGPSGVIRPGGPSIVEFVSGNIWVPPAGRNVIESGVLVDLRNHGNNEEYVQVSIHIGSQTSGHAEGDWSSIAPRDHFQWWRPVWVDGGRCWLVVRATSMNVVPSADFLTVERHGVYARYSRYEQNRWEQRLYTNGQISPGDWAVFTRRIFGHDAVQPSPVLNFLKKQSETTQGIIGNIK